MESMEKHKPGDKVEVVVKRDGKEVKLPGHARQPSPRVIGSRDCLASLARRTGHPSGNACSAGRTTKSVLRNPHS